MIRRANLDVFWSSVEKPWTTTPKDWNEPKISHDKWDWRALTDKKDRFLLETTVGIRQRIKSWWTLWTKGSSIPNTLIGIPLDIWGPHMETKSVNLAKGINCYSQQTTHSESIKGLDEILADLCGSKSLPVVVIIVWEMSNELTRPCLSLCSRHCSERLKRTLKMPKTQQMNTRG